MPAFFASACDITTSRMIIYATRPYPWKDAFPPVNAIDRDLADAIRRKWSGKLPFLRSNAAGG